MKKFIGISLFLAAIIYGINFGMDILISNKFQHNTNRKYVGWNEIIHQQLNADIVIMGSSRAWVQYNPFVLDSILSINSYNLGIDGSNINRQITKYNVYAHYQNSIPKCILINIDYVSTLFCGTGYEREQFFPMMIDPYLRKEICQVEPFSFPELYIPIYRYTTYKGLYLVLKEASYNGMSIYKGYQGQESLWNGEAYNDMEIFHFQPDERALEMFNDFLRERQSEGIQIIFCYAPIYSGLTEKVDNMEEVYNIYETLSQRFQIPIIDYNYDKMCSDTTLFYNATHLNKKGAEIFSVKLAHDLDSLGIINFQ